MTVVASLWMDVCWTGLRGVVNCKMPSFSDGIPEDDAGKPSWEI